MFYVIFLFLLIVTFMEQVPWYSDGLCNNEYENGTVVLKPVMQRVQCILCCEYPRI
jgi:hypothetical protein